MVARGTRRYFADCWARTRKVNAEKERVCVVVVVVSTGLAGSGLQRQNAPLREPMSSPKEPFQVPIRVVITCQKPLSLPWIGRPPELNQQYGKYGALGSCYRW